LLGGLKGWEDAGFALQDFFPAEEAGTAAGSRN